MLEKFRSYLLLISFIVIALGLMLYVYILAKGEGDMFGGEGTLEPTSFETLTYTVEDSGYLLCDASLCSQADADGNAEPFSVDAGRLRQVVADYSDSMPTVRVHNFDFRKSQYDFLERLPGETFPAVVSVRILPVTAYSSKLAFYSYKPVGSASAESHQERAERWLSQLHNLADKKR